MDFPPVIHLISATFDDMNVREKPQSAEAPPQAPQPVATGEGVGSDSATFGGDDRYASVGSMLNAKA